jgi:hypothetical protein
MIFARTALATVVMLSLACTARAQSVWSAQGNTGSNNLLAILSQVAPGDVVEFVPNTGTFPPFILNVGVQLVGPATIEPAGSAVAYTRFDIPAGQRALARGLSFRNSSSGARHLVTVMRNTALEECVFHSPFGSLGDVVLRDCQALAGITVIGGVCSISGGRFSGLPAAWFFGQSAYSTSAIEITNHWSSPAGGTVIASGIVAVGGAAACTMDGYQPVLPASPAIAVTTPGRLLLSDSDLTGGLGIQCSNGSGVPNAPALTGTVETIVSRTTLVGGSTGPVRLTTDRVGLALDRGFALGTTTTATATAGSSQQLLVIVGGFDATPMSVPVVEGPVYGLTAGPIVLTGATPPPGGLVVHALQVPNAPVLLRLQLWLQAFQANGTAAHASPLAGGTIR